MFRLFYTGAGEGGLDLGFAASHDGVLFERFVFNPVVADDSAERHPTNLWLGNHYALYFEDRINNSTRGIALAINDAPAASERF